MMKAGLVIYGSLKTTSGGYLYDRRLTEYLRKQRDYVEIISLPGGSYLSSLTDNFSQVLLRRMLRLDVDVLLQDELNHPSLFLLNRRLRGKISYPIVSIVHHLRSCEARPRWQNDLYRYIERLYLSGVDGLVYNSHTTRKAVESVIGSVHATRLPHVVAPPCGDRLKPQVGEAEIGQRAFDDSLRILFVGNLIPRKGLHVLLKALGMLRPETSWELTVAGNTHVNPAYAGYIARQVSSSSMARRVHFTGELPDGDLADCMRSSHVLAVPSSYEGYGIVYLEGMGFGLPAIGTTGGAARELIADGVNGFLVPPKDAGKLAARLADLAADRQRLGEMSRAALARYHSHPRWDGSMGTIRAFLTGLGVGEHGGS